MEAHFSETWEELKLPFVFVHSYEDYYVFLLMGGNALVEKTIAEDRLSDVLNPIAVARTGFVGFKPLGALPPVALNKAPTPKLRMEVLTRDNRRCRVCGRKPDDDVDLELHVHYIRPSGNGGLSEAENLITLCDTCHIGLDPHEDWSLFNYLSDPPNSLAEKLRRELADGMTRYRKIAQQAYDSAGSKKQKRFQRGPQNQPRTRMAD